MYALMVYGEWRYFTPPLPKFVLHQLEKLTTRFGTNFDASPAPAWARKRIGLLAQKWATT